MKLSERGSRSHAATDSPPRSLSVMRSVLREVSSRTHFSRKSHNDQSMSVARGEMPASQSGLYSPLQKYSIEVSARNALPCAKPGGTHIHSPNASSAFAGMSYAIA